jgi:hypothetical protein
LANFLTISTSDWLPARTDVDFNAFDLTQVVILDDQPALTHALVMWPDVAYGTEQVVVELIAAPVDTDDVHTVLELAPSQAIELDVTGL